MACASKLPSEPLAYAEQLALTGTERDMLSGADGEACRLAMRIIVRMAETCGAREFVPITRAHIDGCLYVGDAALEFAERMVQLGGWVRVPTTLNVVGVDLRRWRSQGVSPDYGDKCARLAAACGAMGARPTWTCAPYQESDLPSPGEHIAWGESSAIVFANSVLGARTERHGDMMDICAAIAGRVPRYGLHLDENRVGQVLFRLRGFEAGDLAQDSVYPLLGYLVGQICASHVPVVEGLAVSVTQDQLKALGAAAASSGAVALYHIIGVTPEARTFNEAFAGQAPLRTIELGPPDLARARCELSSTSTDPVDVVALGCPHYSLAQFDRLARLLGDRRIHPSVQLLVACSRATESALEKSGLKATLTALGVQWINDSCILSMPSIRPGSRVLVTDSGKYAYYAPALLGLETIIAPLEDCVEAAVTGRVPTGGQPCSTQ